ncbi:MAG TPA: hypothetical protein VGG72_23320 [Bryobacteraceae bacterium]|jgi:hypothetical protein
MAAGKPKSKSIIFRITQSDYDRLASKIQVSGERSFSDFARSRVLRSIGEPSLADVGQRLSDLELTIQQLTEALQGLKQP